MKRILVSLALYLCLIIRLPGQSDKGIHFEQGLSWAQVKQKAKNENKFIFVDCFASWCGPCKAMDKDIYPKEKVGNDMNEHFISVKMQMDTAVQDNELIKQSYGDAHNIMQDYKINAFPTFLYFSPDGNIVHRELGYKNEEDFIGICKAAINPDKQYYTLLERFNQGNIDTANIKALAHASKAFGDNELAQKIANDYINHLKGEDLYTTENIWFILEFTTTSKDRGFSIFRDHANKIHQLVNAPSSENLKEVLEYIIYKEEIEPYMNSKNGQPDWVKMQTNVKKYDSMGEETYMIYKPRIIFKSAIEPAFKKDRDWNKILPIIKKQHAGKGEEFLVGSSLISYLNSGFISGASNDCKNFIAAATYYFKNYHSYLTADPLNTWAWTVFQRCSDKNDLATALVWSYCSLKLNSQPNASFLDTYANLLYKLGRSAEAISREEKAVALAPGDKDIYDNFLKMKQGKNTW